LDRYKNIDNKIQEKIIFNRAILNKLLNVTKLSVRSLKKRIANVVQAEMELASAKPM
jgi:hypothetical protein